MVDDKKWLIPAERIWNDKLQFVQKGRKNVHSLKMTLKIQEEWENEGKKKKKSVINVNVKYFGDYLR